MSENILSSISMEQIKNVEADAASFEIVGNIVKIVTPRGTVMVTKALVESKQPRHYYCQGCRVEIKLERIPFDQVQYKGSFTKKWNKYNLDGTEHTHKRGTVKKFNQQAYENIVRGDYNDEEGLTA